MTPNIFDMLNYLDLFPVICLQKWYNLMVFCFTIKGSCYALTYNTKIDQDNTAALLPTGMFCFVFFLIR